jgi:Uma2 family endonuclease
VVAGDKGGEPCYVHMMSAVGKHAPARMTLPEFLSWDAADLSGAPWQLIDGEPVATAPGSETHAALQGEIGRLIGNHLIDKGRPCRLLNQPGIVPRVRANSNFRIPDLAVTCSAPAHGLMVPDPILLIEILSPSDEAQTWANIWAYTTMPSVREIVAVHSTRIEAELLRRDPDGNWPREPEILTAGDTLTLDGIGFAEKLSILYRTSALALQVLSPMFSA